MDRDQALLLIEETEGAGVFVRFSIINQVGDLVAAVMLSQIAFLSTLKVSQKNDGWFDLLMQPATGKEKIRREERFATGRETFFDKLGSWKELLGIGEDAQRRALRILVGLGVIEMEKRDTPGRMHYRLVPEKYAKWLYESEARNDVNNSEESGEQVAGKSGSRRRERQRPSNGGIREQAPGFSGNYSGDDSGEDSGEERKEDGGGGGGVYACAPARAKTASSKNGQQVTAMQLLREAQELREKDPYFDGVWDFYPKKHGLVKAAAAWRSAFSGRDEAANYLHYKKMIAALYYLRHCPAWTSEGGRYIPSMWRFVAEEIYLEVLPVDCEDDEQLRDFIARQREQ